MAGFEGRFTVPKPAPQLPYYPQMVGGSHWSRKLNVGSVTIQSPPQLSLPMTFGEFELNGGLITADASHPQPNFTPLLMGGGDEENGGSFNFPAPLPPPMARENDDVSLLTETHNLHSQPVADYKQVVGNKKLFMLTLKNVHHTLKKQLVIPIVGGMQLDVHKLFIEVTSRGGMKKVSKDRKWTKIVKFFKYPPSATNASYILRRHYDSILCHYEQIYFLQSDLAVVEDFECRSQMKKAMAFLNKSNMSGIIGATRRRKEKRKICKLDQFFVEQYAMMNPLPTENDRYIGIGDLRSNLSQSEKSVNRKLALAPMAPLDVDFLADVPGDDVPKQDPKNCDAVETGSNISMMGSDSELEVDPLAETDWFEAFDFEKSCDDINFGSSSNMESDYDKEVDSLFQADWYKEFPIQKTADF